MDVVIQFATQKLGFQLSDVVIYAWSIGGFTGAQGHAAKPGQRSVLALQTALPYLSFCSHVGGDVIPGDQSGGAGRVL